MAVLVSSQPRMPSQVQKEVAFTDGISSVVINNQNGITLEGDARRIVKKTSNIFVSTAGASFNDYHYPWIFTDAANKDVYGHFITGFEGIDATAPITVKCKAISSATPTGETATIVFRKKIYEPDGTVQAADAYATQDLEFTGITATNAVTVTLATTTAASDWGIDEGATFHFFFRREGAAGNDDLDASILISKVNFWVEYYIDDLGQQISGS